MLDDHRHVVFVEEPAPDVVHAFLRKADPGTDMNASQRISVERGDEVCVESYGQPCFSVTFLFSGFDRLYNRCSHRKPGE
jgi:hypothetical protein